MKISVLTRDTSRYEQQVAGQRKLRLRNHDSRAHPMMAAREYQRALVAAKMERIFAKPFVHSFEGHLDTVQCITRCNRSVFDFFTGSCDGELRYWNLPTKSCKRSVVKAHEGFIEGICVSTDDQYVLTCSRDKSIKQWAVEKNFRADLVDEAAVEDGGNRVSHTLISSDSMGEKLNREIVPVSTYLADSALTDVDYHDEREWFCSSGDTVSVWDMNRSSAILVGGRGQGGDLVSEPYLFVKWSPSETHLILAGNTNNSVGLFDTRQAMDTACQRVTVLRARSNACSWNPMRPFEFAVANDDGNVYTFDVRRLEQPRMTHFGFVHAALAVDFSPAGNELVAGSFDHTVRIWAADENRSREVYFNKRMQSVTAVRYTGDSKYILSGSADFNVRVWRAVAHEKTADVLSKSEQASQLYRNALKEKFKHMPEIKRVLTKRQVPKYIYNATKKSTIIRQAEKRKKANVEANKRQGGAHDEVSEDEDSESDDDASTSGKASSAAEDDSEPE